jgi:hypothetical protein
MWISAPRKSTTIAPEELKQAEHAGGLSLEGNNLASLMGRNYAMLHGQGGSAVRPCSSVRDVRFSSEGKLETA